MMRRLARHAAAALTIGTRLWRIVGKGEAVVLRYHRVAGARGRPVRRAVAEEDFAAQVRFLARRCRVVSLREIVEAVVDGRPMPPGGVAVTFDGGYEDNFSCGFPVLKQHVVPATYFISASWIETHDVPWWDRLHEYLRDAVAEGNEPVGYDHLPKPIARVFATGRLSGPQAAERLEDQLVRAIGTLEATPEEVDDLVEAIAEVLGAGEAPPGLYDPMNWQQVRLLREGGMEIGSHTVSAARLTAVPVERAHEELAFSKTAIEKKLHASVDWVAYPHGCHNADVVDLAEEAGYRAAFTTEHGPVRPGDPPFALRRIDVSPSDCRGALGAFSGLVFGRHIRKLARRAKRPTATAPD